MQQISSNNIGEKIFTSLNSLKIIILGEILTASDFSKELYTIETEGLILSLHKIFKIQNISGNVYQVENNIRIDINSYVKISQAANFMFNTVYTFQGILYDRERYIRNN